MLWLSTSLSPALVTRSIARAAQEEDYEKNPYLKALRDLDYSDDHGPAELAVDCKERGNVAFKRGKAFYGNALKFYNVRCRGWSCTPGCATPASLARLHRMPCDTSAMPPHRLR